MPYSTITTEGGLIPADILDALAQGELTGQRPEDFGFEQIRRLTDEIAAAWADARAYWEAFQRSLRRVRDNDPATTITRERWIVPLLETLGYKLTYLPTAAVVDGRTYAISHRAGDDEDAPPVHIEGIRASLDARPPSGRPRLSPHALMQEYLNSTEQLWGIVTNGERLRLLRDSARFTRPAYVEFDLRTMLEGEQFAEFALLYRLLHRSRFPVTSADSSHCLLEQYHQQAIEAGGRVREGLRDGVEGALKLLGNGLLAHPANAQLRAKLADGRLTPLEYYRQLLRLVYRLLFLMVAEERGLIAAEANHKGTETQRPDDREESLWLRAFVVPPPNTALRIYYDHYSVGRLRRLAESSGTGRGPFGDLWLSLLTTFRLFEGSDEDAPRRLGLAPLDGDLFSDAACGDLTTTTQLRNADLLAAMRKLSLYREKVSKGLRRVNYGALDVEELGSVYESLLDFRPVVSIEDIYHKGTETQRSDDSKESLCLRASVVKFDLVAGTERKTTGSYYTRPELVQELIKSALVPVLEKRIKAVEDNHKDTKAQRTEDSKESLCLRAFVVKEKEQALLSIRVVDPACGSGAFLLAAARRIGRELAKVRAGEDQPTPAAFRHAVRDVIQRCIFGVDMNPLATDLCKLALWIEGHCAGMPLSFLDHHIKRGNSLIGATRELVAAGVPDDAYKPVTGDDKAAAGAFRKRNKKEREAKHSGQLNLGLEFAAPADAHARYASSVHTLSMMPDNSVAAVRAKARQYEQLRAGAYSDIVSFNLWTAAFFSRLTDAEDVAVPTTASLDEWNERPLLYNLMVKNAFELAQDVGFFHWELEFPQVFHHRGTEAQRPDDSKESLCLRASVVNMSGFDVVLGNPPWERIKLQEQEHFVDVPAISQAANKSAREKMIAVWRNGDESQRARIAEFDAAKYRAEAESRFVRASERFPLTAVGDVNTYALFAEQVRTLLSPPGRAGIIVPTGIATDDTTKDFFGDLSTQRQLVSLYDFENREAIFPGVHRSYKFSLLTIGATREPTQFIFFAANVTHLTDKQRVFTLTPDEITLINPNTRTAPVFRTRQDAELTKKIYRRAPVLLREGELQKHEGTKAGSNTESLCLCAFVVPTSGNPWGVSFLRMLDMSNDSHLFQSAPGEGLLPLYEAKLLHQFTHRWATYQDSPQRHRDTKEGEGTARDVSPDELADPTMAITPRYWVPTNAVADRLAGRWDRGWLIGFRDIARSTDERTAIFSLLPRVGIGNNAPVILFQDVKTLLIACFLAIIDSMPFDFVTRPKVGGIHLNFFIVNQLPVLPPSAFTPADIAYIVPRVVELVYTAWDIKAFAEDVWGEADNELRALIMERRKANHKDTEAQSSDEIKALCLRAFVVGSDLPPPFIWHDTRRAQARAELDARIAKLYGLTRDELRYILDPADVYGPDFPGETFRVLKEKETRLYGEYRTRRLVLEAWDGEGNQH